MRGVLGGGTSSRATECGSRGSGPAITSKMALASATVRPIGAVTP